MYRVPWGTVPWDSRTLVIGYKPLAGNGTMTSYRSRTAQLTVCLGSNDATVSDVEQATSGGKPRKRRPRR